MDKELVQARHNHWLHSLEKVSIFRIVYDKAFASLHSFKSYWKTRCCLFNYFLLRTISFQADKLELAQ